MFRVTVDDVLPYLAAAMTPEQVVADFPPLTLTDIRAVLAYAADRERRISCRRSRKLPTLEHRNSPGEHPGAADVSLSDGPCVGSISEAAQGYSRFVSTSSPLRP